MEDRKTIAIAIALSAAMVLMFVGVVIYARVRNSRIAEETVAEESVAEAGQEIIELEDPSTYQTVDVADKIVTINDVDMDAEDSAIHDVEVENTYINTTPLLPSIFNEREKVTTDRVDVSAFPDSYVLNEQKAVSINDSRVGVPKEVYLYNTGIEKSS